MLLCYTSGLITSIYYMCYCFMVLVTYYLCKGDRGETGEKGSSGEGVQGSQGVEGKPGNPLSLDSSRILFKVNLCLSLSAMKLLS